MAAAKLIYQDKGYFADGGIVEMTVWQLPAPDVERPHGLKYSLFYGRDGKRVIGYDNERGKGDHRHYGKKQVPYRFVSMQRLIADFLADVRRSRGDL